MTAETQARTLGTLHGEAGKVPYGNLDGDRSARLMNAIGETGPTTQDNHDCRLFCMDAYVAAWEEAADSDYPW